MVWPFNSSKFNDDGNDTGKLLSNNNTSSLSKEEGPQVTTAENVEQDQQEEDEGFQSQYKYAPKKQDEEAPMDLWTLQDIFSFSFMRGRPILNFFLAIIWSIGLPVLLYNLLKSHIGQVLAMIVASAPPLAIVIVRMLKDRTFDPLGCVAGVSFLISGILSIAQPDENTSAICEGIVPLLVGVSCVISVIPIKIGSFELKPFVFQMANQIMPRNEPDDALLQQDDARLSKKDRSPPSGQKRLDYLYTNMAKFRHDMRFMTVSWGILLIATFIVKVILVETQADISKAQTYGYWMFAIATAVIFIFTWIYTNTVKGHVLSQIAFWKEEQQQKEMDQGTETAANINWGVNSMSNTFSQVVGGG